MAARMVVVRLDACFFGEKNGSGQHQNLNQRPQKKPMRQPWQH
jgi:hypothetical protein